MVTLRDLSKYANISQLHPENMTPLLVLLAQGQFVAEDLIPVVPSPDDFQWLQEEDNDKFTKARKRGENGGANLNDVFDSRLSASTYEYFEGAQLTAKQMRTGNTYGFVNLLVRKMDAIAGKIRLTVESDVLSALQDTTTYSKINTHSCSVAFTTRATSDPIKDFTLAANEIRRTEHIEPNVIVIGGTDKTNMVLSESVRDTKQYTVDYTEGGLMMERVAGYRLLTSTATYKSGASLVNVLSGQAIMMRTNYAGELREAQPYMADSEFVKGNKVLKLYGSRVLVPIVVRPQAICVVKNVS